MSGMSKMILVTHAPCVHPKQKFTLTNTSFFALLGSLTAHACGHITHTHIHRTTTTVSPCPVMYGICLTRDHLYSRAVLVLLI